MIQKLTKPYATLFPHKKGPNGQENVGGLTMRLELEAGLRVDVFWPGTGPIVPEERLALKQLFTGGIPDIWPPFSDQATVPFGSGGGLSVPEFLADDSTDPCLHRLEETACLGGHVVRISTSASHWTLRYPCNFFEIITQFSQLRELRSRHPAAPSFAFMCSPNERAVVPCSFWQLKQLVNIDWNFEPIAVGGERYGATTRYHFEKCPEEIGALPNLVVAEFVAPDAIGELPAHLFQSPKLEVLSVEDIPLGNLPSLERMPNLKRMLLSNNNITGPFPSFANKERLQEVSIQSNSLQIPAGGTASFFDNCSELTSVSISDTYISHLFRFVGSTNIIHIYLSHNQINSTSFPKSWSHLTNAKTLDVSYNSIQRINTDFVHERYNVPSPLRGMSSLVFVDFSHNEIADEIPLNCGLRCGGMGNFLRNMFDSSFPTSSVNPVLEHVDLSYNELHSNEEASPMIAAFAGRALALRSLSFHHNRLAGVFSLWNAETCKWNFDGSYNRITGITIQDDGSYGECAGIYFPSMRMDMSNQVFNCATLDIYAHAHSLAYTHAISRFLVCLVL
jgi:hypothetical protein